MANIKVKDLLELFDNEGPSGIKRIVINTKHGGYPLMDCKFKSWKNITNNVLERNILECNICMVECELTLYIIMRKQ